MVLTDKGEVLSFGLGRHGQLGHGDEEDQLEPKVIESLSGVRVVAIAAGFSHSMVLTEEGEVLSFGVGWHGQLGYGDMEWQLEPKVIEALRGTRVVEIAAGVFHSMVLTDEGAVLSFGQGVQGQLGHGNQEIQQVPKAIEALRGTRVVAIAAGHSHGMVLTEDEGAVLTFGEGASGRLGHGDRADQLVPKAIAGLQAFCF